MFGGFCRLSDLSVISCSFPTPCRAAAFRFPRATFHNKSDAAGATFGNIVLDGGIGWAIDPASGADNKYTSPVNITLVPLETQR